MSQLKAHFHSLAFTCASPNRLRYRVSSKASVSCVNMCFYYCYYYYHHLFSFLVALLLFCFSLCAAKHFGSTVVHVVLHTF